MVNVAIYARLSDEDRDKQHETDESESIHNQKAMLRDYCRERDWAVYDIYCDEDYSGIDSNRPDFKRMLSDCESGDIDVVLCKSQSRFSRDMEVVERYIHNKFIEWNVRFISIVDRADSHDIANKKARQINGLINEWYLEDTSENIRKTLQSKRQRGEFTGSFAPYGYIKDPEDKNHLIIDEYAAGIVRDIYNMYLQGWGYRKIAICLNEREVLSPTVYKQQKQGIKYHNKHADSSPSKGLWSIHTIAAILKNEYYTGTLVQGKTHYVSYKNKKKIYVPEDEWIKVPDSHEAVIDPLTWAKTQERLSQHLRAEKKSKEVWTFAGKLYCAECGRTMRRINYYNKKRTKKYYNLVCGSYTDGTLVCTNTHSLLGSRFEASVIEELNKLIKNYCKSDKLVIQSGHEEKIARLNADADSVQKQIEKTEKRISKLYLDKLENLISKEQYIIFNSDFEKELAELKSKLKNIGLQVKTAQKLGTDDEYRESLIEKYTCITELTRPLADEFIKKIEVDAKKKGTKKRKIYVYWKV